jgi:hypothetical protein
MMLFRYGLINRHSLLGRLVMRIPRKWFYVSSARVGNDVDTFITIRFRKG